MSFLFLFIFMAFRGLEVGTDVLQYQEDFNIYKTSGLIFSVEPFWYYLNKLVIFLGGDFRDVLILSSLLILVPVYFSSKNWSQYPLFSIFFFIALYFYCNSFNAIRQSVSISFGLCGVLFFLSHNKINSFRGWLFIIISFLFHYSSGILIIALFIIPIIKKFEKYLIGLVSLSFFTGAFLSEYFLILAKKITNYNIELYNIWGNLAVGLILNIVYIFIYHIIKVRDNMFFLFTVYVILANLLLRIPFGYRFVLGLGLIQIVFFPSLIKNNRLNERSKTILVILLILYSIYTYSFYLSINFSEVLPYKNILFND